MASDNGEQQPDDTAHISIAVGITVALVASLVQSLGESIALTGFKLGSAEFWLSD